MLGPCGIQSGRRCGEEVLDVQGVWSVRQIGHTYHCASRFARRSARRSRLAFGQYSDAR
jgi:hypothetical protein